MFGKKFGLRIDRWLATAMALALSAPTITGCAPGDRNPSKRVEQESAEALALSHVNVDPADCPDDGDGRVYVSLGEFVIGIPYESKPLMRSPLRRGAPQPPAAPMPPAPEGCRGHPAAAQLLSLWAHQERLLGDGWTGKPLVSLTLSADPADASYLQRSDEALLAYVEKQAGCTPIADGIVSCGKPDATGDAAVFVVSRDHYALPDGKPLVVVCGVARVMQEDCTVNHALRDGVTLRYRFYRYPAAKQQAVPIERVAELDRAIRAGIARWTVHDYAWGSPGGAH